MDKRFGFVILGGFFSLVSIVVLIIIRAEIVTFSRFLLFDVGGPLVIALAIGAPLLLAGRFVVRLLAEALLKKLDIERRRAEIREIDARASKIQREAEVTVITAPIGHQIHIADTRDGTYWRSAHLEARIYANGPGSRALPTADELAAWLAWQELHSTARRPALAGPEPPQLGPGGMVSLEPILPRLVAAQRLIIAGGSDAGKTTLIKHIIAGRADHSRIVVIDPHAPSKVLGFDVIGSGRDYAAIGQALESLEWLMTSRYHDVREGVLSYGQHNRVSVFIDEWTSIARYVDRAGEIFETLLTESRKVNIHLTVITHSPNVDTLGISAAIRKSAILVEITGGQGEPRRAFIHPTSKTNPDGSKARPREFALPGPFVGFPQPAGQVILELPDARTLQAQAMASEGASPTAIAREFFGVQRPNGQQINEVRELLERAQQARQNNDNGAM